jgi:hypothetical protein
MGEQTALQLLLDELDQLFRNARYAADLALVRAEDMGSVEAAAIQVREMMPEKVAEDLRTEYELPESRSGQTEKAGKATSAGVSRREITSADQPNAFCDACGSLSSGSVREDALGRRRCADCRATLPDDVV